MPLLLARRLGAVLLKLSVSALVLVAGLELGTRLLMPADRFEVLPTTFDPACLVRNEPHGRGFVRCPEYSITILINGGGLRADREHDLAAPGGLRRILCLGDSFTFGLGVPADATFAAVAQRALAGKAEVLNGGHVGTGTAEQLAWYGAYGRAWRPDVVVLAFCVNDWTDSAKSGLFCFAPDSTLVQHPAVEDPTLRRLRKLRSLPGYGSWFARSHFVNRFRQWYAVRHHGRLEAAAAAGRPQQDVWQAERALTEALLRRLRAACRDDGADLLVMPVPALAGSGEPERQLEELMRFLTREGFETLDLRDTFAQQGAGMTYPVDGHWTEAGHRVAAAALTGVLSRTGD